MEKVSEIWKDIGYNRYTAARYVISADGRIMNKNTGPYIDHKTCMWPSPCDITDCWQQT